MPATYFDHNATTPLEPEVRVAMEPWLGELHGNPASLHAFGQAARDATEVAREQVAGLLGARPAELVFMASGTEANNAVLLGRCWKADLKGHLVVSGIEHPSVWKPALALQEAGMEVSWVDPDRQGRVDPEQVLAETREDTRLVCLMLANNEVGTLQLVEPVAAGCRERGIPVLCDAVQAIGKVSVNVGDLNVDYLSIGAHKFYGPLGAAALWVRPGASFEPLLKGGSQERQRRAGTVNVPAAVGLGEASRLVADELEARISRMRELRERFENGLGNISDVIVHARSAERLPNTSHLALLGADSESLLIRLDLAGFAVSSGSACSSGTVEPSRTLLAMGVPREEASCSLRISFGPRNTLQEVDAFLEVLAREVAELRRLSSVRRS
jgi:cysteine desulfurase